MFKYTLASALSLAALATASCGHAQTAQNAPAAAAELPFTVTERGKFNQPWAMAFEPGTSRLFVTLQKGGITFLDTANGQVGTVTGAPAVDFGGQGGMGEIKFAPDYATSKAVYLTWAEAGDNDTRGAVLGRGILSCATATACAIGGLTVIWRQTPKVTGRGHFSHRIAFSPDGKYLFLSSGERQQGAPAQDLSVNLGKVLRLNLDGTPAAGNPFADRGGVSAQIWSYGHRNLLGLKFDAKGQLWDLEHGPRGGDELNLVERGVNYGWPVVSNGINYDGSDIPPHRTKPEFRAPAISWNPVIAPGDFIFYSGKLWPQWKGNVLATGLGSNALVRVTLNGAKGAEAQRWAMGKRMREIVEAPDGSIWIAEDGANARLVQLKPR
ncbi:MAG: PQQ-dependent sugar dehydrogenase [Croceibacterium sp.]